MKIVFSATTTSSLLKKQETRAAIKAQPRLDHTNGGGAVGLELNRNLADFDISSSATLNQLILDPTIVATKHLMDKKQNNKNKPQLFRLTFSKRNMSNILKWPMFLTAIMSMLLIDPVTASTAHSAWVVHPQADATVSLMGRQQETPLGDRNILKVFTNADSQLKEVILFQFDTSFWGNPRPKARKIQSATLRLWLLSNMQSDDNEFQVLTVRKNNWNETTVAGSNNPNIGKLVSSTVVNGPLNHDNWVNIDVTDVLQDAYQSKRNKVSFALAETALDREVRFRSKDFPGGANIPELIVVETELTAETNTNEPTLSPVVDTVTPTIVFPLADATVGMFGLQSTVKLGQAEELRLHSRNQGRRQRLQIFFKFSMDLTNEIDRATLKIYLTNDISGAEIDLLPVDSNFREPRVTGRNAPATGTAISRTSLSATQGSTWIEVDVTQVFQDAFWNQKRALYFALAEVSASGELVFSSKEGAEAPYVELVQPVVEGLEDVPSASPSGSPKPSGSSAPSGIPTGSRTPSLGPSAFPSSYPSFTPSVRPSSTPSIGPSAAPSHRPSFTPSLNPSISPSERPSQSPSRSPSSVPSASPTLGPSGSPSVRPSKPPSTHPSASPSLTPTYSPSLRPSASPSATPTSLPSVSPSARPSSLPSASPTSFPTVSLVPSTETPPPTQEKRLVMRGLDGTLEYEQYENQVGLMNQQGVLGGASNKVPDFSTAGYMEGDVPIPFVPVAGPQATVFPIGDGADDSAQIQAAIDYVASLPIGANGFRGAVLLKAGDYNVFASELIVEESGIVIRGEGSGTSGGTTITYRYREVGDGQADNTRLFRVGRLSGNAYALEEGQSRIVQDFVPVGSLTVAVADPSGFRVGEEIAVHPTYNDLWLHDMSNMAQYGWTTETYTRNFYRRVIKAIAGNVVLLDAPIMQPIESQYGGGYIKKLAFSGQRRNIGIENMRLLSNPDLSIRQDGVRSDEDHGRYAVHMMRVEDVWVRQVSVEYFWGGAVFISAWSSYVTVEDSSMTNPISRITGSRRYAFHVDDSEFVLIKRCLASDGRHDFVTGSTTNGPTVFVDNLSLELNADNGPHHRFSTGILMDSMKALRAGANGRNRLGDFHVQNRKASGSGHGWTGAQVMFWNLEGRIICDSPNGGMNWAVGCIGPIRDNSVASFAPEEPAGMFESHGTHVEDIRSLFYAQLHDRKGTNTGVYHASFLPQQKDGYIWDQLETWGGDGLFLDPLATWHDEDVLPLPFDLEGRTVPVQIGGIIRDLNLLGMVYSSSWSQTGGPAIASFSDPSQLETTVRVSANGNYIFALSVNSSDGTVSYTQVLEIQV